MERTDWLDGGLAPQSGLADRRDASSTLACRASKCCGVICLQAMRVAADSTEITASSVMALPSRIPGAMSSWQTASSATGWQVSGGSG